jgi:hypothetical protein
MDNSACPDSCRPVVDPHPLLHDGSARPEPQAPSWTSKHQQTGWGGAANLTQLEGMA